MVSCAPSPMTSSRAGSLLLPAVSYSISMPFALTFATVPPSDPAPRPNRPRVLRQPTHRADGCRQGRLLRGIGGAGMVCNRRPQAGILDVAAKRLESETAVGPPEQVDAAVVLGVLDAVAGRATICRCAWTCGVSIVPAAPPTTAPAASARAPNAVERAGRQQDRQRRRIDLAAARARLGEQRVALRPLAHQPGRRDGTRGAPARRRRRRPARRAEGRPARGRRARRRAGRRSPPRGHRSGRRGRGRGQPCRRTVSLSNSTIGWARGLPVACGLGRPPRATIRRRMRASIGSRVTARVRASS